MPLNASFSCFITTDKDSDLDRSRGRVQLIEGNFFYSPNSRRDVQLPPVYDEIPYCDCFKHGFAEFCQPLWWQPACPYLAFLPLRPVFAGVPFQDLFHISYFPRLCYGGFMINPQTILGWARLEKDIRDAVELLLTHERAPPIMWIVPTEWFSQFMGGFSYATAIWLSGVMLSIVATFDSSVNRAGIFIQLHQRHRDQFSIDWLCDFAVPLQEVGTFLTRSPTPQPQPQPTPEPQTQAFDCAASSAIIPSWKAFFEKRQARNEHLKARETDKQRQSRESREKNPPVKRTKVFLWKRIEGGGYRRESFYQAENGMHLDAYNKRQKIYDAFSNEWDCCSEFGEPSQGDFADDNDIDDNYPMMPPPSTSVDQALRPGSPPPEPSTPTLDHLAPAVDDRSFHVVCPVEIPFDWEDFKTSQLLYEIYGFIGPLPLPTHPSSIDKAGRSLLLTIVGLRRDDSENFKSPVASFALQFLNFLNDFKTPKNTTWDIADGNRMSISGSKLFRQMYVIKHMGEDGHEERWHVFDFKEAATVPWKVAVPNVIDAFYVCRLDHTGGLQLTDFEVARELLNRGVQFCTFLPVKPLPCSITPAITVPVHLSNYKFTQNNYFAYKQQCAALLSDPGVARSALLHGGIVWRLAVATLSFDDVLEGPTTAATLQRCGIVTNTSDSSTLCDDGLSQLELDIICGQGNNYASKSWWPMDSNWQKNAQHTHWTERSDHFFRTRHQKLQAGTAEPLNFEQWRQNICGSSSTWRVNNFVTSSYQKFVEAHL
ncbi:hypothetical protein BYT27DRAFT_7264657 [Phlegmacium glaucopus]|nr:hypothetical protein BYT27DRAFT_7264657 [Phlegmacium glaucopus]